MYCFKDQGNVWAELYMKRPYSDPVAINKLTYPRDWLQSFPTSCTGKERHTIVSLWHPEGWCFVVRALVGISKEQPPWANLFWSFLTKMYNMCLPLLFGKTPSWCEVIFRERDSVLCEYANTYVCLLLPQCQLVSTTVTNVTAWWMEVQVLDLSITLLQRKQSH